MAGRSPYVEVFSGTFVASTPWWGGGPYGRVRSSQNEIWFPSEETITGKTKWFARQLYYICYNTSEFDHKDLEKKIENLFGYVQGSAVRPSMFRVIVEPGSSQPSGSDQIAEYYAKGKLMRVTLGMLDREYLSMLDLPVNGVSFRLSISVPHTYLGGSPEAGRRLAAAVTLTLAYAGIGRAANRGFGRFYPAEYSNDLRELADNIKGGNVLEAFRTGLREIFTDCKADPSAFVDVINCGSMRSPLDALEIIGESFLAKNSGMSSAEFAVFGLPRKNVEASVGINKIMRMQSPVIATPVMIHEADGFSVKSIALLKLYSCHLSDVSVDDHSLSPESLEDKDETPYHRLKAKILSMCGGSA
ncbi:MAG: RAMP superfamily CRISPR-associated protein [Nitrososphaeria archaeon]